MNYDKPLPSWETAVGWYSADEIFNFLNRRQSVLDDPATIKRRVPTDVYSREFAEWMTNEYRLAMAKGIQMANDRWKSNVESTHQVSKEGE